MTARVGVSVPDVIVALTRQRSCRTRLAHSTDRSGTGRGLSLRVDVAVTQLVASPVDSGVG